MDEVPLADIQYPYFTQSIVQDKLRPEKPNTDDGRCRMTDNAWSLAERCWAHDASSRPRVGELCSDLEQIAHSWTSDVTPASSTASSPVDLEGHEEGHAIMQIALEERERKEADARAEAVREAEEITATEAERKAQKEKERAEAEAQTERARTQAASKQRQKERQREEASVIISDEIVGERLNEMAAGAKLNEELEQLITQQEAAVRREEEWSKRTGYSVPEAELEKVEQRINVVAAELEKLKMPFTKRMLAFFTSRKSRKQGL